MRHTSGGSFKLQKKREGEGGREETGGKVALKTSSKVIFNDKINCTGINVIPPF